MEAEKSGETNPSFESTEKVEEKVEEVNEYEEADL